MIRLIHCLSKQSYIWKQLQSRRANNVLVKAAAVAILPTKQLKMTEVWWKFNDNSTYIFFWTHCAKKTRRRSRRAKPSSQLLQIKWCYVLNPVESCRAVGNARCDLFPSATKVWWKFNNYSRNSFEPIVLRRHDVEVEEPSQAASFCRSNGVMSSIEPVESRRAPVGGAHCDLSPSASCLPFWQTNRNIYFCFGLCTLYQLHILQSTLVSTNTIVYCSFKFLAKNYEAGWFLDRILKFWA